MDDLQVVVPEMENWIVGCLLGGVVAFKGLREYRSRKLAVTDNAQVPFRSPLSTCAFHMRAGVFNS